jgi:hypothetical protein
MTINDNPSASSADNEMQATNQGQAATQAQDQSSLQQDANTLSADTSAAGDTSATKPDEQKSLLDVVKDVVDSTKSSGDDKDSLNLGNTDGSATNAKADGSQNSDEGKPLDADAEDAKLPFHKHPRFQQVIQERTAFKRELDSMKPDADEWRAVRSFMDGNSLNPQEVAKGFEIMAAMKNDPIRAKEMLSFYWGKLEEFSGSRLPNDLKQKVDEGEVTDEVASELARRRNEIEFYQAQKYINTQRQAEQVQMQQQAYNQNVIRGSVVDWESNIKTRDADYSVKQPFLMDKVKAAMAANPPRNSQEAVALVDQAYREVNDSLRRVMPQRAAATSIRSETSSANVAPQPKSLRDAIRLAAAGQI